MLNSDIRPTSQMAVVFEIAQGPGELWSQQSHFSYQLRSNMTIFLFQYASDRLPWGRAKNDPRYVVCWSAILSAQARRLVIRCHASGTRMGS